MDNTENKANMIIDSQEFHNCSTQSNMFANETQPLPEEEVKKIEKTIKKQKRWLLKANKKFLYFIISILLYSITHLLIRYDSMETDHFLLAYFQVASLTIFIPLSFLKKNIEDNFTKTKPKEIEQSSSLMAQQMRDEFSEIMEKKFYENYFEYSSKFYLHSIILSSLYYISLSFYYWGLYYIPPLIGNSIFASTAIVLQIIKIVTGKYKLNLLSNFILILYSCGLCCLFGYLHNLNTLKSLSLYGLAYFSISAITTALFIFYFNSISKKYKFYIDVIELLGFAGLFCLLIIPFFLLLVTYLTTDSIIIPMGTQLLIVLAKSMLCSCVNDVIILKCISLFSMSVEVTSLGSLITLLYVFQVMFKTDILIDVYRKIYFAFGVTLILLSFILSIAKFCEIELGQGSKKDKNRTYSVQSYYSVDKEERDNKDNS